MRVISIVLILSLSSCATSYKVKRCTVLEGIETCSTATIRSFREFPEGLEVTYEQGKFALKADKVSTKSSPLEQVGAQAINTLLSEMINNKEQ